MYPNRRGLERRWAALALVLLAPAAWAHDADLIYVLPSEAPGGALEEVVTLSAGTLGQLAPIDADRDGSLSQGDLDARADALAAGVWDQMPVLSEVEGPLETQIACMLSGERALLRDGYVELTARFACPAGPLSQDFRILRVLSTNYRVVLGRQVDGEAGRAFAQGNVQRLLIRPGPISPGHAEPGFGAGGLSVLVWFDVTLVWLLSLLLAGSVRAVVERWLVVGLPHAAVALASGSFGIRVPGIIGAAIVAVVGTAFVLQVLARGHQRWPLSALGLVAAADALRAGMGGTLEFQAGRSVGLFLLAAAAGPILLMIARRPAAKRKATVALACASLAAFGFSLVQTLRAF